MVTNYKLTISFDVFKFRRPFLQLDTAGKTKNVTMSEQKQKRAKCNNKRSRFTA